MDKIAPEDRVVVNLKTAKFKPFLVDGAPLPGQSFLQLDETFPEGAGFTIYRMAPNSETQPHEHTCHEQFLVLEGELEDHDGHVYKPGDFVLLKDGTRHFSRTRTGCTLAVFVASIEKNI
ncbi:MAG: cupin domain-containing protein [Parvibaculaceae bacterium]